MPKTLLKQPNVDPASCLTAILFRRQEKIHIVFGAETDCALSSPGVSMSPSHPNFDKQTKTRKKQKRLPGSRPYRYSAFWAETPVVTQCVT